MNYRKLLKELVQKNLYQDEYGDFVSQWKEDVGFQMSDELKKALQKLYFEAPDELVPPRLSLVPENNAKEGKQ